jgi:hypothetical protein
MRMIQAARVCHAGLSGVAVWLSVREYDVRVKVCRVVGCEATLCRYEESYSVEPACLGPDAGAGWECNRPGTVRMAILTDTEEWTRWQLPIVTRFLSFVTPDKEPYQPAMKASTATKCKK